MKKFLLKWIDLIKYTVMFAFTMMITLICSIILYNSGARPNGIQVLSMIVIIFSIIGNCLSATFIYQELNSKFMIWLNK